MSARTRHDCSVKKEWVQWNSDFYGLTCPYGCDFTVSDTND